VSSRDPGCLVGHRHAQHFLVDLKEIDVDSVTALVKLGLLTLASAYSSHWLNVIATFIRNWTMPTLIGLLR
jgi:hypothetical protein